MTYFQGKLQKPPLARTWSNAGESNCSQWKGSPTHPGSNNHCCTAPFASLEVQRHKAQQHLFATKAAATASWAVLSSRYELVQHRMMHDSFSAFSFTSLKATDDASNRWSFTAWIYFFKLLCNQLNGWSLLPFAAARLTFLSYLFSLLLLFLSTSWSYVTSLHLADLNSW